MTGAAGRGRLAALAAVVLATVAGGFAGGGSGGPAAGAQTLNVLEVSSDEWRIETSGAPVAAGRVTLDERNLGGVEHDLTIVRTSRAPDALPVGLEGVAPELAGEVALGEDHRAHGHDPDGPGHAENHLRPGERRQRTVTLSPGAYVLLCPIPGHYEQGQAAAITVR